MKKQNYFLPVFGFFTGLLSGIVLIGLFAFSGAPATPAPGSGITPVSPDVARGFFAKYMADAAPLNVVVKGFTIDKSQLDAMNAIAKENSGLTGFRVYMGKDYAGRKTAIVVGVDNTGKDAVKNTIFSTDVQQCSPCPPVCDVASPIIGDK